MMARPELLNAILQMESGGNPKAQSRKGARGLMQLMPGTAIEMGLTPDQFDDPGSNVVGGVGYFNKMLKRYKGNEWKALIAYNAGPGAMDSWTIPPESLKYAANVLRRAPRQQKPLINRALGAAGSALSGLMGEGTAEAMWPFTPPVRPSEPLWHGWPFSSPPPKSEVPLMPSRSFEPGSPRHDPSVMRRPFPPGPPGPGMFPPKAPGSTLEIPSLPRPNPATTPTRPANVAPAVDSGSTPQIKGLPAGWSVGNAPVAPTQASQAGEIRGLPPGWKISAGSSSGRITIGDPTTTAERTSEQKIAREEKDVLRMADDLAQYYDTFIKPRVQSGKLGSQSQAYTYTNPAWAKKMGYKRDPYVEQFMTKSGPLGMALNAYYASQSGGKGGISLLEKGTYPHAPHPPTTFKGDVVEGKWDLELQRGQLDAIRDFIKLRSGQRGVGDFGGLPVAPSAAPTAAPPIPSVLTHPPDAVRLSSGRWYSKSTKQVYDK